MTTTPGGPIDDALWQQIQQSVPIACTDVVPVRGHGADLQVGLIRRPFPGPSTDTAHDVWCHLGGRVLYGESTGEAVDRHLRSTLVDAVWPELDHDRQPHAVVQWFPGKLRRDPRFGDDPRKHAVSLCWALDLGPDLVARDGGEGIELRWFDTSLDQGAIAATGADLWPGTALLVSATLAAAPV